MARRTNSIQYPGAPKGARPGGNSGRLPQGAKVSITTASGGLGAGGADSFTGRVPGAMKGVVGGSGTMVTNSRPFKNKGGAKGIKKTQRN